MFHKVFFLVFSHNVSSLDLWDYVLWNWYLKWSLRFIYYPRYVIMRVLPPRIALRICFGPECIKGARRARVSPPKMALGTCFWPVTYRDVWESVGYVFVCIFYDILAHIINRFNKKQFLHQVNFFLSNRRVTLFLLHSQLG